LPARPVLKRLAVLLLAVFACVSAFPEHPAAGAVAEERVVIADGHVDIGPRLVDGRWLLGLRDDTVSPQVWRSLDDVVLQVVDGACLRLPPGDAFSFLAPGGAEVWLLPQVQQQGILWPGWNTQDPSISGLQGPVTWKLEALEGPGEFALFLTGSFGDTRPLFSTMDKLPQEMKLDMNSHVHGNWAFTAPGIYCLEMSMEARGQDGQTLSDLSTLRFAVGPVDPDTAFASTTAGGISTLAIGLGAGAAALGKPRRSLGLAEEATSCLTPTDRARRSSASKRSACSSASARCCTASASKSEPGNS
jgi:putative ABC transporter-associated repeat protein